MTKLPPGVRTYARAHISNVLGLPESSLIEESLLEQVFRELSRTPEVENPIRDIWGNWDFSFGESNLRGELYEPWLDKPLVEIRRKLEAEHVHLEPLWPEGKRFALCLTHDVDLITTNTSFGAALRMIARDAGILLRDRGDSGTSAMAVRNVIRGTFLLVTLRSLRLKRERTYDEWLKLEDRHGFRSTFLFFPTLVRVPHVYDCLYSYDDPVVFDGRRMRVRGMMNELVRAGWDVGLHGSFHSALRPGMLAEQKRQIEAVVDRPVIATRQHWLHYDVRVTPKLQGEAGLLADSTQGFNRNVGFRAGTAFPYLCWDIEGEKALPVLEVPQHVMDGALFTSNALEYDVELAVRHCLHLMEHVQAVGGCLTLSWHPNTINDSRYWAVYEAVLAEAARRRAWGCSMSQLHRWWTERAARIAARSATDTSP